MRTADESSRSSMLEVAASDSLKSDKGHERQNVIYLLYLQEFAMCLSQHLQQSNPGRICLLLPDLFATTGKPLGVLTLPTDLLFSLSFLPALSMKDDKPGTSRQNKTNSLLCEYSYSVLHNNI